MITERLVQVTQAILNALFALNFFKVAFINKPRTESETKFIVIRRGRKDSEDLPGADIPHIHNGISHLRPDGRIFGGLHILGRKALLTGQAGRRTTGNHEQKDKDNAFEHGI